MSFAHLHTHSHYSLLDGLAKIDDLINEAKKYNISALAITDHGVMYGAIEFYKKAKAAGIKPIIGCEVYVAPNGMTSKKARIDEKPFHLVLLAKNYDGYKNLVKLVSLAHLEGFYYKPRVDKEILKKYSNGLIALTACLQGEIPRSIVNQDFAKAEKLTLEYKEIFKDNLYLELQYHESIPEQKIANEGLLKLAKKLNLPIIATNDIHYVDIADAEIQDILLCLQTKHKKEDKKRLCMLGEDFSFRSPETMSQLFYDYPEAIKNSEKIANECNLELELGKIKLPHFPVPDNLTPEDYLEKLCRDKISNRYPVITDEIKERLNYELSIIKKTEFASYFLIVEDFVNWAKTNGIVVGPGRGSAAGSIVSYILNITNIDPIAYNLVFERFLNPERISMPDIDLDFADTRRDEVIRYVENKYGQDHVAQIITFGTMAARAAVRDVGRVLDYPYSFCDMISKMIPANMNLNEALETVKEFRNLYETNRDAAKIINTAKKLEGVARHASKHACGVVITPQPLTEYLPLQLDTSSENKTIITQYEMHAIEDLGLLKMDFLGLKNLSVIEDAIKIINHTTGEKIDIDKINLNDEKAFKLLQKGETTGVFQLESDGMKRYLKELKPTELEDIMSMVALYRPGPIESIPNFIAGKHHKRETTYLDKKLEPILKKTYGVIVTQDQVLQIARDFAGFTYAEADILRKAVGKKIEKLLVEQEKKFKSGAIKNGASPIIADKVWDFILPFARYGFNRAHAACYAMLAYQTAYLKSHYPAHFMAALLTSDLSDTDRIAIEVEECRKMDIEVLPPDVNESLENFTVVLGENKKDYKKIRFGLLAIKNVGAGIVKAIINERKKSGNFKNFEDFVNRIQTKDFNKKSLESLIKSGALDKFEERGTLLENTEFILDFNKKIEKDKLSGQTNMFGFNNSQINHKINLRRAPDVDINQKLMWEKELLGLFISAHPMAELRFKLKKFVLPINEINNHKPGSKRVLTCGIITSLKKIITANKELMIFAKIEDETGSVESIIFPKILNLAPKVWEENKTVIILGRLSDKDNIKKIIVEDVAEINKENAEKTIKDFDQLRGNLSNGQKNGNVYYI